MRCGEEFVPKSWTFYERTMVIELLFTERTIKIFHECFGIKRMLRGFAQVFLEGSCPANFCFVLRNNIFLNLLIIEGNHCLHIL